MAYIEYRVQRTFDSIYRVAVDKDVLKVLNKNHLIKVLNYFNKRFNVEVETVHLLEVDEKGNVRMNFQYLQPFGARILANSHFISVAEVHDLLFKADLDAPILAELDNFKYYLLEDSYDFKKIRLI